jgi:multicomponent Na+:H+ antiporter subunit E
MFATILFNVLLALLWVLLNENVTRETFFPSFVAGNIVAALVQWIFRRIHGPERVFFHHAFQPRKIGVLLRLGWNFLYELVLSNIQVVKVVIQPKLEIQSALIRLPIELENDLSITLLANMITMTPGTITMDVADDRKSLVIHCLNVTDIEGTKQTIREKFELPLRELER